MNSIFVKTYGDLPYNLKEILRYAGVDKSSEEITELLNECMRECEGIFSNKVCYGIFRYDGKCISKSLSKNLEGCSKVIVFAATVGIALDRHIMKYSRILPSKALILQAIGAERIETLCDAFCNDISSELGITLKPRFSAGYGDLPLEAQKDIFSVLDCSRKIGLTLNDSLLMSPTKSVTAIVGIKDEL